VIPFGTPPLLTCSTIGAQMLSRSGDGSFVHNALKMGPQNPSPSVNAQVGRSGVFAVFISRPEFELCKGNEGTTDHIHGTLGTDNSTLSKASPKTGI